MMSIRLVYLVRFTLNCHFSSIEIDLREIKDIVSMTSRLLKRGEVED